MRFLLYLTTAPYSLLVSYPWVLLMCLIRAAHNLRWEKTGVLTAEWRPWAAAKWQYSTTLGRGIVYQDIVRNGPGEKYSRIQEHEHVHVRQVEDNMMLSLVVGLVLWPVTGSIWTGLIVWTSGGVWQLTNFITAMMRHGVDHAYRAAEHERSAYAQTDARGAGSWLSAHLKRISAKR
jgi:hypothetical protein